jgi:Transposase DDE domain group 1
MQTECSADLFGFAPVEGRAVVAAFDGGRMTSEAGAMLLGATDGQLRLIERFAGCFTDYRAADLIEHTVPGLVGQRVFGIALGYEDLIDHDQLRHDPVMAVLGGKLAAKRADCAPLAGKSTLNRLELSRPEPTRYHKISYDTAAIEGLFVDLFLDAHSVAPPQITLDLDATDDPLHGHQEERFFHGYYDHYCYLPLYVFCGRHLLAAKLRPANIDASAGSVEEMARIVTRIRQRWPKVRILLRADSGFAREALMVWCENNGVDFLFGLAKNRRLVAEIEAELAQAAEQSRQTEKPARRFKDFIWQTRKSWSRERRVVAKAEWTAGKGHLAGTRGARGPPPLRKALLRPWRDGKPHQGMPARPLCRPHFGPHDACQPIAPVVRLDGLCPDRRLAPHRLGPHAIRPRLLRDHPPQVAEDRGAGAHQCAPHQARHALGLPLSGRVPRRLRRAHRRHALTRTREHGQNTPATRPEDHCLRRDS